MRESVLDPATAPTATTQREISLETLRTKLTKIQNWKSQVCFNRTRKPSEATAGAQQMSSCLLGSKAGLQLWTWLSLHP